MSIAALTRAVHRRNLWLRVLWEDGTTIAWGPFPLWSQLHRAMRSWRLDDRVQIATAHAARPNADMHYTPRLTRAAGKSAVIIAGVA